MIEGPAIEQTGQRVPLPIVQHRQVIAEQAQHAVDHAHIARLQRIRVRAPFDFDQANRSLLARKRKHGPHRRIGAAARLIVNDVQRHVALVPVGPVEQSRQLVRRLHRRAVLVSEGVDQHALLDAAHVTVLDQAVHDHLACLDVVVQQTRDRKVDLVAVTLRSGARERLDQL